MLQKNLTISLCGRKNILVYVFIMQHEMAVSCTIVFKVWLSLMPSCTAIRFSAGLKNPLESPGMSSKLTGTGAT